MGEVDTTTMTSTIAEASKQASEYQFTLFDFFQQDDEKYVREIPYYETKQFLLKIHYARRMPSISYAFGLFLHRQLIGCVTYGVPASPNLCMGLAGIENKDRVLELNRLVLLPQYNGKNYASYIVSHSLKMLPNRTFVVSYADTAWSHVGYIYQATNFLYTGLSASRTDTYQPSGKHSRHQEQDDNSIRQTRSSKHRYVYLVGDRRTKRQMLKELRYPVYEHYPKGDETHYDINNPQIVVPIQIIDRSIEDD